MREGARRVIITVSALVLIGITVFCISGTVHSSEKEERREREKYYREIYAEYVKEVRFFLNEEGYSNSGVTMTKVIDEEENRSYTMTIHHHGSEIYSRKNRSSCRRSFCRSGERKWKG